jgi:HIRAN domain
VATCGGSVGKRIRHGIVAVLAPEPTNPHDANAIAVQIDGHVVGYLPRAAAQEYLPSLKHLMSVRGGVIALRGVIAAAATAMTGRDDSACG